MMLPPAGSLRRTSAPQQTGRQLQVSNALQAGSRTKHFITRAPPLERRLPKARRATVPRSKLGTTPTTEATKLLFHHGEIHQEPVAMDMQAVRMARKESRGFPDKVPPVANTDLEVFVLESDTSAVEPATVASQVRQLIDERLPKRGALLFRGLPVTEPLACAEFTELLQYKRMNYEPFGAPRKKVAKDLDAATNIPGADVLPVHQEMCYNPHPNKKIMLICLKPAPKGGESLIANGADITTAMDPKVVETFAAKGGIKYWRRYPAPGQTEGFEMSWEQRTGCSNIDDAEQFWRNLGCQTEQQEDGSLTVWNVQPALAQHPDSGKHFWFNLAHMAINWTSSKITYGDDDPIPADVEDAVSRAVNGAVKVVKLQAGDMLVLDNYWFFHGRMDFQGDRLFATLLTAD